MVFCLMNCVANDLRVGVLPHFTALRMYVVELRAFRDDHDACFGRRQLLKLLSVTHLFDRHPSTLDAKHGRSKLMHGSGLE